MIDIKPDTDTPTEKTDRLMKELELLRRLLWESDECEASIPILMDIANSVETEKIASESSVTVVSPAHENPESYTATVLLPDSPSGDQFSELLRKRAKPLIENIVEQELMIIRERLTSEFQQILEHWLTEQTPNENPEEK